MRWYYICIYFFLLSASKASGQSFTGKPNYKEKSIMDYTSIIDSNAINNWPSFGDYPRISNDGKYFKYNYSKGQRNENILVVSRTDTSWKMEFTGADYTTGFFSSDSKLFVLLTNDTLCLLNLKSKELTRIINVNSIKLPEKSDGEWIGYQLKGETKILILFNLLTGQQARFNFVDDYLFDKIGSVLVLKEIETDSMKVKSTIKWISLPSCKSVDIWESYSINEKGKTIAGINISATGKQLAFIVKESNLTNVNEQTKSLSYENLSSAFELWYYRDDMDKAVLKATNNSNGIKGRLSIYNSIPMFSKDEKFIYFQLYHPFTIKATPEAVMVDVWSYKDTLLQCTQLQEKNPPTYVASVSTINNNVVVLTNKHENIITYPEKNSVAVKNYNTFGDRFWRNEVDTNWLVSLLDGTHKLLPSGYKQFVFSPEGKHLIYYDYLNHNYYKYDPVTDKCINISFNVPLGLLAFKSEFNYGEPESSPWFSVGIAAWEENDNGLFVYDNYDIWRLDPSGKTPAINITNGFGRLHCIKFRFTYGMASNNNPIIFKSDISVLLTAFNTENKYNGFYRTSLNKRMTPKLLMMGPQVADLTSHNILPLNARNFNSGYGMPPIKAKNAKIWIIKRQSTSEPPNYFLTSDFKSYKPLTNFQPQKSYNWLSGELIKYRQLDGTYSQGILYKPEDFDSTKKYPVIFNFYQQRTHRLYQFPTPEYAIADIDVAWFVSRGYLVFTPDIYFKYGQPGPSAYNSIISAVITLAEFPFVDSNKIGINGHSVAGGLTNYLITHTNKFAAAIECAGVSNTISATLQLGGMSFEMSRMEGMELSMGNTSIWENPKKYLEASAIMNAHKVVTPLLIMHNKSDGGVPWAQALELFLALRRLEKPVWMLQYDNGDHTLWERKKEALDFTIRITQYFDHYLKGAPAPKWMTHGVPAYLKGIESRYELVKQQ